MEATVLICGYFNYLVDDPAHKPYSSEFMELLNINDFENHALRPTYASGRAIDLVLLLGDSDVDDLKVLPISSNISDHNMVFLYVNFPKSYSFAKSITLFKKYQRVAYASHFCGIEQILNEANSSTMSARQLV